MLRVGLTGGIGSGKSTVARRLVRHGALLIDADALAREVVAAGTDGLAEVVAAFGERVLRPDGELDRPAVARIVFGDAAARERLNAIVHPRVRSRTAEMLSAAPADAIVVQDIPLLVETGAAPSFPLVVVVHAAAEERVRRLVELRGMPEADARARIAAQVDDDQRLAAADVRLGNDGGPEDLESAVDALWSDRMVPFEANLRGRRPARRGELPRREPDPAWAADAARITARVAAAAGARGREVAHVGPTAVPVPAPDVLTVQLGVASAAEVTAVGGALADAGFPPCGASGPQGRRHANADPGRAVDLWVREVDSDAWRAALRERDRLRSATASSGRSPSLDRTEARRNAPR